MSHFPAHVLPYWRPPGWPGGWPSCAGWTRCARASAFARCVQESLDWPALADVARRIPLD